MLSMLSSLVSLRSFIDSLNDVETDVFIRLAEDDVFKCYFIFLVNSEGKYSPNVGAISKKIGEAAVFVGDLHR
jgi:hypothetical protein